MYFTLEKLRARMDELVASTVRAQVAIEPVYTCPATGNTAAEQGHSPAPESSDPCWHPLATHAFWGGNPDRPATEAAAMLGWGIPADGGHTHWLRATMRVPEAWQAGEILVRLDWEEQGQASIEAILSIDGAIVTGIDQFHKTYLVPPQLRQGQHELLLRVYTPFPQPFGGLSLQLRDPQIMKLVARLYTIVHALPSYTDANPTRHALLNLVNQAYSMLDTRAGWQAAQYAESAHRALAFLEQGLDALRSTATDADLAPIGARPPRVVGTGHAHLDTAWLWPLWRTRQKAIHTVATALSLMDRYPDYRFSLSQPQVYQFIQQDAPELYQRLKERAKQGRLEQVGLMWIEADCNVPSGESLVRQFLEGSKFYQREFGQQKHLLWLPDVFGYSAALPQILRGCGIDVFMTTKISWNQFNRMPNDTFRWRGIDGSEVLTHFVTATDQPLKPNPTEAQFYTYNGTMLPPEVYGTWQHYRQKAINDEVLYIYGWGDGGGGPTEEMLELAEVMADLPGFPQVQLGRVDEYFERVYQRVWQNPELPTWVGELYLEYHRGTYTSQSRTKQHNRAAELLYREAEWLNVWNVMLGGSSQQEQLNSGWRTILLNQFHDILPGSSVPLVYVESNQQFAEVQQIGMDVAKQATQHILANDDHVYLEESQDQADSPAPATQSAPAQPLVVLNTLPWDRDELASINLGDQPMPVLPGISQQTTTITGERIALVASQVPGYGYAELGGSVRAAQTTHYAIPHAQRECLENGLLRVEFDQHGEITQLHDLEYNRQIVLPGSGFNQLVTYEDRPLFWEAWDIDIFYEEKPYPVRDIQDWRVVEQGPLRSAIEITRRVGNSTIRQRISLARGSRRLDFTTEVDWQERQTLLRTLFPCNLNTTRATCEIQFGAVERTTHRNTSWEVARFEVCAHRWVDLSEGGYGVALLNNGKYGHSLRDTTLGMSLLKAGIHPDPKADEGMHHFTYSILPHNGDWRTGEVVRRAYELNASLRLTPGQVAAGSRSQFLQITSDHVVVETVKVADDGNGIIVRMYEAHNQRGEVALRFPRPIQRATEVNLLEQELGPVQVAGNTIELAIRPFEVKTVRIEW